MKKVSVFVLGEKFELGLEDEFFEYVKDDLLKLQNITPKKLLGLILEKNKSCYEVENNLKKLLEEIEEETL